MRRIVVFCVLLACAQPLLAQGVQLPQEPSKEAIQKARDYLKKADTGRMVMLMAHFGVNYLSHGEPTNAQPLPVMQGGQRKPGEFGLAYDFQWGNGDRTKLAFLCDPDGNVYKVQTLASSGFPFVTADLGINLLRDAVKDAVNNAQQLNPQVRRTILQEIERADAKGLLAIFLKNRLP